jgi:hypothetical protein
VGSVLTLFAPGRTFPCTSNIELASAAVLAGLQKQVPEIPLRAQVGLGMLLPDLPDAVFLFQEDNSTLLEVTTNATHPCMDARLNQLQIELQNHVGFLSNLKNLNYTTATSLTRRFLEKSITPNLEVDFHPGP